jgi:hypothetical protein
LIEIKGDRSQPGDDRASLAKEVSVTEESNEPKGAWKTFTEEIEVAGHQLVNEINRVLAEGNVRKLVIKSDKGDVFLSVPLTGGAVAGGIAVLAAPWLVIIAAVAGVLARVKIEVLREEASAIADQPSKDDDETRTAA